MSELEVFIDNNIMYRYNTPRVVNHEQFLAIALQVPVSNFDSIGFSVVNCIIECCNSDFIY